MLPTSKQSPFQRAGVKGGWKSVLRLSESYHQIAGQHINGKERGVYCNLQEASGLACLNELSARVSWVTAVQLVILLQPCQLVLAGFHFHFYFCKEEGRKLLLRTLWVFQCYSFKKFSQCWPHISLNIKDRNKDTFPLHHQSYK